ncbi:hypothetical protein CO037_01805, partial [Candidatus Pacearchaeota archaeon CG_4_9_14_0_2_um_filter_30_8]
LILILSILNSAYFGLWHIMSTNIFLLVLVFSPQILKKSYNLKFPKEFEILLLIFIVVTLFLGQIKGIFAPILFGIGTGMIGLLILFILYSTNKIKKNYPLIVLFSFNFAIAFGVGLELIKYYIKIILNQSLDGGIYIYTMNNLTYVLLGAAIASGIGFLYLKTHLKFIGEALKKFKSANKEIFKKNESPQELIELIKKGEGEILEFKSGLRINLHTNEFDKKIEHSNLKTLCAFLNSDGGTLIIGVDDKGKILGIEKDNFENSDKMQLHLSNLIKQKIGKENSHLISIKVIKFKGKEIIKIECKKSKKPIFLKDEKEEEFYIRTGPSTSRIQGRELLEYVKRNFEKEN